MCSSDLFFTARHVGKCHHHQQTLSSNTLKYAAHYIFINFERGSRESRARLVEEVLKQFVLVNLRGLKPDRKFANICTEEIKWSSNSSSAMD